MATQTTSKVGALAEGVNHQPTTSSVYHVCTEINDQGWLQGRIFFTSLQEAIKHLRHCAAHRIVNLRRSGYKVDFFHVWRSQVLHGRAECISITFRAKSGYGCDFYDMRIGEEQVYSKAEYADKMNPINWNE